MKRIFQYIVLISTLVLLWSCGSSLRFTGNDTPPKVKPAEKPSRDSKAKSEVPTDYNEFHNVTVLETQTGTASYYADEFHGNHTSSGEIYDMYGISAAHPTYPVGTIVRVTNLSNNLSEILRINDRMPVHPDRIIDLSYGAAEKLNMINNGLAEVKIEVLKWGDENYKK